MIEIDHSALIVWNRYALDFEIKLGILLLLCSDVAHTLKNHIWGGRVTCKIVMCILYNCFQNNRYKKHRG